jgi:hypothetical protein
MKVLNVVEQEDGSAIIQVDLSAEETRLLLERAIVDLLKETLEHSKTNLDNPGWGSTHCKDGKSEQSCQSGQCGNCTQAD